MSLSVAQLQQAVERTHGGNAKHLETVHHREVFRGAVIWEGAVSVFELSGHPKATRCYAWGYPRVSAAGGFDAIAILGLPPVDSVAAAVKIGIAALVKRT